MTRLGLAGPLLGLALGAQAALAAGSWVAEAPSVRVAVAGRDTPSEALMPPAGVEGRIAEVRWRFRTPSGAAPRARLCHPAGCVALPARRGRSEALAGLPAEAPLRFRFSPAPGQAPLVVEGLQVIVNYR